MDIKRIFQTDEKDIWNLENLRTCAKRASPLTTVVKSAEKKCVSVLQFKSRLKIADFVTLKPFVHGKS